MFSALKLMKLRSAIRDSRNLEAAFTAVQELGRMKGPKAVDLLIESLGRLDNVARSAARELGRIGDERAAQPLAEALSQSKLRQAAQEGLAALGSGAVEILMVQLRKQNDEGVRKAAAEVLGKIGDKRAVEPLVEALGHDDSYGVRIAAAQALAELQDQRAVWVLVATLKLRDETTPERQQALAELQQAADRALQKIGNPLTQTRPGRGAAASAEEAVAQLEEELEEPEFHPRLLSDLSLLSERDLVGVLRDLVSASEEISWAKLENREPLLAAYFKSYEQRRATAERVGQELLRRGGRALLDQVLARDLNHYESIKNWWSGLG